MPQCCFFDRLPVELLHCLFAYLWAHEILFTFSDVSDHLNAILMAYTTYQLNFRFIRKDHFDLICKRIPSERVISLVLSDENETPGQSDLFFSYFRIEQFTQLQTLTLIKIEADSSIRIFPNLYKLHLLRSLTILDSTNVNESKIQMNNIQSFVCESFIQITPHLTRIHMTDGIFLASMPLPNLRYLKLETCSIDELEKLTQHLTQLKSFSVCLDMYSSTSDVISLPIQLVRLHLKIESKTI